MLRAVVLSAAALLFLAAPALAETVTRGAHNGMLALGPTGTPYAAFVRGKKLVVSRRLAKGKWKAERAGSVASGSQVYALAVGAGAPIVVAMSPSARTLFCFRRTTKGWQHVRFGARLPASDAYGLPGLALDAKQRPVVAYTRWNSTTLNSTLMLVRINAKGNARTVQITRDGFPQSLVPPPSTPVLVKGKINIIESFGYQTVESTIEWYPRGPTWEGLYIDAGRGEFPVGSVFAASTAGGKVYAAWSQAVLGYGAIPVTLATGGREPKSEFLVDRGFTTGLALVSKRPEVAANEWVPDDPNDVLGTHQVWAAEVLSHASATEMDGRVTGYAADARGRRNLLLSVGSGLSWFRTTAGLTTHVTIRAEAQGDGSIAVSGSVSGVRSGKVTLYRERFGAARTKIATPTLSGGTFSFRDRSPERPALYRAVYRDARTGIPYAALLRKPVG